jgi:hypothetical protein
VRCESIDVNLSASGADLHVATHLGDPGRHAGADQPPHRRQTPTGG